MKKERPSWQKQFYSSQTWIDCRKAYAASKRGLCENCLKKGLIVPGEAVHHIVHMNAETVKQPELAYGWDNLMLLCRNCHAEQHRSERRWSVDADGNLIYPPKKK